MTRSNTWAKSLARRSSGAALAAVLGLAGLPGLVPGVSSGTASAQDVARREPQVLISAMARRRPPAHAGPVRITSVNANIDVREQVSATTLELTLTNPSSAPQETVMLLPVPDGVVVRSLEYDGVGPEPTASVLPRDEARRIYDEIVSKMKDPALVEFAGFNLIRTSVFPIPANGSQKLRLTYEQVLPLDGQRVDYALPRTESLGGDSGIWTVKAEIRSKQRIATVYSPSHEIVTERLAPGHVKVSLAGRSEADRGSVRLSYLLDNSDQDGLSASIMAYPDAESGGGYFMLLGGLPAPATNTEPQKRELTIVLDRSGSMDGQKFQQALAAARRVIEGLREGEAFNIIDYSDSIASFAEKPVIKSASTVADAHAYLTSLRANGGTNIHDAMVEAVRQPVTPGMLPLVLFLTDGLPTVGQTGEVRIRDAVKDANTHARRIFTFGVGVDVNAPLLDHMARTSRGATTIVLPDEDVEVKVSQVYRRLEGPVMSRPVITVLGSDGRPDTRRVRDQQPFELGDLFEGDQLVVLARYLGDAPVRLRLQGECRGQARSFEFEFDPKAATLKNGFVPRLWAGRRIAELVDEVRQSGAEGATPLTEARMKELVDEVVRLSMKFGILTEYTAFLAKEETAIAGRPAELRRMARDTLQDRAMDDRSGAGGANQQLDIQMKQAATPARNSPTYVDKDMKIVEIQAIQNIADLTLFKRRGRWVDSRILDKELEAPDRTVEFGTEAYRKVLDQLVVENRQSVLAVDADVLVQVGAERVLVKQLPAK